MSEMLMCFGSKKDLCVCVQELLPIKMKKRTTRSKKRDEKQVLKMKAGELMSSKVEAGKHIHKPVLTLSSFLTIELISVAVDLKLSIKSSAVAGILYSGGLLYFKGTYL